MIVSLRAIAINWEYWVCRVGDGRTERDPPNQTFLFCRDYVMSWGRLLQPDLVLGECILQLRPEIFRHYGLTGAILDVDETLVPSTTRQTDPQLLEWVAAARQVVDLYLVSNNLSDSRIGRIAEAVNLPYLKSARKPSRKKLRQAIAAMDLPPERVAMVGDRLFTDVLAGNRLGMFTILVQPMVDPDFSHRPYPTHAIEVALSKAFGARFHPNPHQ